MIAKQAGYQVSGSDKQDSQYIQYLKKAGISNINIGQTKEAIVKVHDKLPIDWYVYSSAVAIENLEAPELLFVQQQGIRYSKRDELLNTILQDKKLQLIAVAGTHGKTTTTAMTIWLLKQLQIPISYSVGAKINFGPMGTYQPGSQYFVYEADEFDRNFLAFKPFISLITGVSWDHHEIFPTREDYQAAFSEFISQGQKTYIWQEDKDYLRLSDSASVISLDSAEPLIDSLTLAGRYNRLDAWLVISAIHQLTATPLPDLIAHMNNFPGLQRRMEQILPNLYSDYAHTPEKIRGCMSVALELAAQYNQKVIVIYEPLTNRRQHYMIDDYKDCFAGVTHLYWLPTYLAREDPAQRIIPPEEMISHLSNPGVAEAHNRDQALKDLIQQHLDNGDMVVAMAGGGGNSLDEWLRREFNT